MWRREAEALRALAVGSSGRSTRTASVLRGAVSSFILPMLLMAPPQAMDSESSRVLLWRKLRGTSIFRHVDHMEIASIIVLEVVKVMWSSIRVLVAETLRSSCSKARARPQRSKPRQPSALLHTEPDLLLLYGTMLSFAATDMEAMLWSRAGGDVWSSDATSDHESTDDKGSIPISRVEKHLQRHHGPEEVDVVGSCVANGDEEVRRQARDPVVT